MANSPGRERSGISHTVLRSVEMGGSCSDNLCRLVRRRVDGLGLQAFENRGKFASWSSWKVFESSSAGVSCLAQASWLTRPWGVKTVAPFSQKDNIHNHRGFLPCPPIDVRHLIYHYALDWDDVNSKSWHSRTRVRPVSCPVSI